MLNQVQLDQFQNKGYLVVEDLVDQSAIAAVGTEYEQRVSELYQAWYEQGWIELKDMWDETRTRLSSRPYLPQHRWDIYNPYCA